MIFTRRPGNTGFFVPVKSASVAVLFLEMSQECHKKYFRHKKRPLISRKLLFYMARPRRFERPTTAFGGLYSIQLSYGRVACILTDRRGNYDNIVFKCAKLALPRSLTTSGASCFLLTHSKSSSGSSLKNRLGSHSAISP